MRKSPQRKTKQFNISKRSSTKQRAYSGTHIHHKFGQIRTKGRDRKGGWKRGREEGEREK